MRGFLHLVVRGWMRTADLVRPIAKQSALIAKREARRGQTAHRLFGLFRLDNANSIPY